MQGGIPIFELKLYTAHLVLGLEHIHDLNIVHNNICPENILIGNDGNLKIGNFENALGAIFPTQKNEDCMKVPILLRDNCRA